MALVSSKRWSILWLGFWLCLFLPWNVSHGQPTADAPRPGRENPDTLTASIYDAASHPQRLLYRFRRVVTRSGPTIKVLREFTYPDGKPAAREQVLYDGNGLKAYELEELQTGWTGTARVEREPGKPAAATIVFEYARNAAAQGVSARREPYVQDTLVSDMIGPFLASHWEALQQGQKVSCRYVVVQRRETIGFTFRKESESKWKDRDVIILKMHPTSRFLSALVDPLYFTVEKSPPHRVLQYLGRTIPKTFDGNQWKDLDAVTVFDWADLN
jgi:hypothetical protein